MNAAPAHGADSELQRQAALLRALHQTQAGEPAGLLGLPGRLDGSPGSTLAAGLHAYRVNARAIADRALAAAYPVVQQLLGPESFEALAHAVWRAQPPERGDLAWFGAGLAGWIAGQPDLADERYLPDLARLEWAVHRAQFEADHDAPVAGLALLGEADPAALAAAFVPGTALLASEHPIVAIWVAHQLLPSEQADLADGGDRFAAVRAAFDQGRRDHALVWRRGWRVEVGCMAPDETAFTRRLLAGERLGAALDHATRECPHFNFETWLLRALREGWLAGFDMQP